jgi:hypothetical protein
VITAAYHDEDWSRTVVGIDEVEQTARGPKGFSELTVALGEVHRDRGY